MGISIKTVITIVALTCYFSCISGFPRGSRAKTDANIKMLDNIDIDKYLSKKRVIDQQIRCVLEDVRCDTVGKEIKKVMSITKKDEKPCDECTPPRLQKVRKLINHMRTQYPTEWGKIVEKYGPPPTFITEES